MTIEHITQRLAAALGDRYAVAEAAGLDDRLAAGLAAIHTRWPNAPRDVSALGDYFADRLVNQADLAAAVDRLPVDDMFLAWWAGSGDSAGIAAFEAAFADDIARIVVRFHKLSSDELRQRLRIKLFVGTDASPPKIHDYTGSGSLAGWLRVTAARTFVDAARADMRRRYEVDLDDIDMLGIAVSAGSIRDHGQRAELAAAIKHAFADAVSRLAPRERTFLRHATVDGLTLDQIAATYRVHRATVARTLKSGRERLLAETRAGVATQLHIEPDQLASALTMLDSKLDLSLSRVLRQSVTLEG